jgi:hypothetical protein
MRIVVLWEDKRASIKRFGPHDLLVSCAADELQCARDEIENYIVSAPKKGNGTVISALQQDAKKLSRSGPVCAVIDRDKVQELWPAGQRPPACLSGIRRALAAKAPGNYELVLLIDNMETIIEACCQATRSDMPRSKPSPDTRDRILRKIAWGDASARASVRGTVPSFERLVQWVASQLSSTIARQSKTAKTGPDE